jgi:thymidylate synthase (FAD)
MGLDSVGTLQQPAPSGNGIDVTNVVVQDLIERRDAGTRKYGTPLRTHNGRSALVDAYQEAMDLTLYLRQKVEEERDGNAPAPGIELTDRITVKVVQQMGGDHMVVAAARVSTGGEDALREAELGGTGGGGLINYLIKHRHGTPFEHAAITFFVHAPIFVWREWHRHRIGFSYNEESARYKQLKPVFWVPRDDRPIVPVGDPGAECVQQITKSGTNGGTFTCGAVLRVDGQGVKVCPCCKHEYRYHTSARPKFQPGTPQQMALLINALSQSYRQSYATYSQLLEAGYAKEVARACLPVAIYSSCWVTCNPRSLMAFLSLRTHEPNAAFVSYPQAEIEQAARVAEQALKEGWPLTYEAFVSNGRVAP